MITTSSFPSSSMRTSSASRQPEPASSESSDSDTNWESIFGPQPPRGSKKPSQRTTSYPLATISRARESSIRRGSEGKLQDFINMRDQADKATEVRGKVWCWMRCRAEKREETENTEKAAEDLCYWHFLTLFLKFLKIKCLPYISNTSTQDTAHTDSSSLPFHFLI